MIPNDTRSHPTSQTNTLRTPYEQLTQCMKRISAITTNHPDQIPALLTHILARPIFKNMVLDPTKLPQILAKAKDLISARKQSKSNQGVNE